MSSGATYKWLSVLLFVCTGYWGFSQQRPTACGLQVESAGGGGQGGGEACGPYTTFPALWGAFHDSISAYVPLGSEFNPSGALKTIRIAVNVWGNGTPGSNYDNTQSNIDSLNTVLDRIEREHWMEVLYPSDPSLYYSNLLGTCPNDPAADWYACRNDTRLRMEVVGIFFHDDSALWASTCNDNQRLALNTAAVAANPVCATALNIHIVQPGCCITTDGGAAGAAYIPVYSGQVSFNQGYDGITTCATDTNGVMSAWTTDFFVTHWAHELGHCMQLQHVYPGQDFATETTAPTSAQAPLPYLSDVFGQLPDDPAPQTWCTTQVAPAHCLFQPYSLCDPYADPSDDCTNNLMGNNLISRFTSPLQMARMQRSLSLGSTGRYAWGYDSEAYAVGPLIHQTLGLLRMPQILDFRVKMYQDLHIKADAVVVIKCIVEFVPEARLVVEPGGKLIIDGGLLRTAQFADSTWRGVEIWGSDTADRSTSPLWTSSTVFQHQGAIEIKNGGRIENAEIGILFGSRDSVGKGGGVLLTDANYPAIIRNCATGIEYQPYISANVDNRSTVRHVHFERDADALPGASGPFLQRHIKATGMHPLVVERCTFTNQQPGLTGSLDLGQGITSINSTLQVRPACVGGTWPCTANFQQRNTFTGLDHAIQLIHTGAGSARRGRYSSVLNTTFTNNICGVYANGMPGFTVKDCEFTLGNNPVELTNPIEISGWEGFHRALYGYNSYAFTISGNSLVKDTTATEGNTEGIVIGYSEDHNDAVRLNEAHGLDRAYVGEGVCADVEPAGSASTVGLQFLCNTNDQNATNFWSRMVDGALLNEQPFHTIRLLQGYLAGADNLFDRWPRNAPDRWDYKVTSTFGRVRYRLGALQPSPAYTPISYSGPTYFGLLQPGMISSLFCQDPLLPFPSPQADDGDQKQLLLDKRLDYGHTRYLYDALLDGGSTDQVVQEITSSWASDAWNLRDELLDLSPLVSAEVLKTAVNKAWFPLAMKAEVCLANPDATQSPGFYTFLEQEANEPFPPYLLDLVEASWDEKTYRTELEMELADRHYEMSQTANALLLHYHENGSEVSKQQWVWQQLPTTAARYGEAVLLLGEQDYNAAHAVVQTIQADPQKQPRRTAERERMLAYIDLLKNADGEGRRPEQLNTGEVDQLKTLRNAGHDRASNWINNLLCAFYSDCVAPLTGGEEGEPKALTRTVAPNVDAAVNWFRTAPNPAQAWVTFNYRLVGPAPNSYVSVTDVTGRALAHLPLSSLEGQLLLDTRELAKGVYAVHYVVNGRTAQLDKLILN